jgi:hypothetical protein
MEELKVLLPLSDDQMLYYYMNIHDENVVDDIDHNKQMVWVE